MNLLQHAYLLKHSRWLARNRFRVYHIWELSLDIFGYDCGYCDIAHGLRDLDSLDTLMTINLIQFVAFVILNEVTKH